MVTIFSFDHVTGENRELSVKKPKQKYYPGQSQRAHWQSIEPIKIQADYNSRHRS